MQFKIRSKPKNHGSMLSASLRETANQITLNGKVNYESTKNDSSQDEQINFPVPFQYVLPAH